MNLVEYINMTPEFSNFISVFLFGIFITSLLWFLYMNCVEIYHLSRELRILHQNSVGRMENIKMERMENDSLLETNHSEV
jgi:hypothetical protein